MALRRTFLLLILLMSAAGAALSNPDIPDSLQGRVYNDSPALKAAPSIPFVAVDSTVRAKKFWIGHKQLISNPVRSIYAQIVAQDSVIYVAYSSKEMGAQGSTWIINRVISFDYGMSWGEPLKIEETSPYNAGELFPRIAPGGVLLASSFGEPYEDTLAEIRFRKEAFDGSGPTAPVRVDNAAPPEYTMGLPQLFGNQDTTWLAYFSHIHGENYLNVLRTLDQGTNWDTLISPGPVISWPMYFFQVDNRLAYIGVAASGTDVVARFSDDGGYTWTGDPPPYVSAFDGFASQWPGATSYSTDLHVGWFDFDGVPSGWYGYIFYAHSLNAGVSWEPIRSLSTGPCAEYVAFWADSQRVYAVWNDCREFGSPDFALYMRYSHDRGASWSPEFVIKEPVDPARRPDMYGQGDLVYVVWEEQHPPDWIWGISFMVGGWYTPGDMNRSETVDVSDLTFLVRYLFQGGKPPVLLGAAEMNGFAGVSVSDLTYLVNFLFKGGPSPIGAPEP